MTPTAGCTDDALRALALPFRTIPADLVLTPQELMGDGRVFGPGRSRGEYQSDTPTIQCGLVDLGSITALFGRTTPLQAQEEDTGISSLTLCYAGTPNYRDGTTTISLRPGQILINPRTSGTISTGYLSSINFPVHHARLRRTIRAMQGDSGAFRPEQALVLGGTETSKSWGRLFAFFGFIENLLQESRWLGMGLGLDEQLHRLVALALLQASGKLEGIQQRWAGAGAIRTSRLDDLVDFIRANAHRHLTLTDLEEQSHYCARQLQYLFSDTFRCTPMQFVRRQKLAAAREQLETADPGDSVTRIARECGYRSSSNFSTDFKAEYGITPSSILRRSGRSRS